MIDVEEHVYSDDPADGHADVRTYLKDVDYFFIGNGLVRAAIQFSPGGQGSPYGLLIEDPRVLGPKRAALTMDRETGLSHTMLSIIDMQTGENIEHASLSAAWTGFMGVPAAEVNWGPDELKVRETFYCPDFSRPLVIRRVWITNPTDSERVVSVMTGLSASDNIQHGDRIEGSETLELSIEYRLDPETASLKLGFTAAAEPDRAAVEYWQRTASFQSGDEPCDRFFRVSSFLLPAVISRSGRVDASIWQYNREWVRDQAHMALGLVLSGQFNLAETILQRLLDDFISPSGSPLDSSEERDFEDAELDQNGWLLTVLKTFYLWSGRLAFIRSNWERIERVAEFPLRNVFRHETSGLLTTCRDYWERHAAFGIRPGFELAHQVYVSMGLADAAVLAGLLGREKQANRWQRFADSLKERVLNDPLFRMVDENGFIKRKNLDGSIQDVIVPDRDSGLPPEVPLARNIRHTLRPDTASTVPVAGGFVAPDSETAGKTLEQMELLWNQDWDVGGYGRYNCTSEADSSGPWPFPSLFVARAYLETGDFVKVKRILNWLESIPGGRSGSWFEMYGNRIAPPYAQIGITPWTWAEIIVLFVQHIAGVFPEKGFIRIRPRLLPEMKELKFSIPIRNNRLNLDIRPDPGIGAAKYSCSSGIIKREGGEILINYSDKEIFVTGIIPVFT